jgi:hypothetical protein
LVWLVTSLQALKRKKVHAQDDSLNGVFPVLWHALDKLIKATMAKKMVHIDIPVQYQPFQQERSKRAAANPLQECNVDSSDAVAPAQRKTA